MTEGAGDVGLKFEGETERTESLEEKSTQRLSERTDVAGIEGYGVGKCQREEEKLSEEI